LAALFALSNAAWAQEPVKQQGPPADASPTFLAFDVSAGIGVADGKASADNPATEVGPTVGWNLGASLRLGVRWAGVAATFGHDPIEGTPAYHLLAGPRFYIGRPGSRWIAHALVGVAGTRDAAPRTGSEFVLGGGLEFFIFRLGFDYARVNLAGLPKNNGRGFFGVVIPFCVQACGDKDVPSGGFGV
jgi:hypothetical protein